MSQNQPTNERPKKFATEPIEHLKSRIVKMTKQTKITADTTTDNIEYVPLAELFLSDLNPRQEVDQDGIELLAQSLGIKTSAA
jgi:hypothetical protein